MSSTIIDNKLYRYRKSPYDTKNQIEKIGIAYIQSLIGPDYDEDMVIYNTMKKLQGTELDAWFREHFIPYIIDDKDYNYNDFFLKNIPFKEWLTKVKITRNEICGIYNCESLIEIFKKLNIKINTINYQWPIEVLIEYWKYFIKIDKFGEDDEDYDEGSESLKEYIICAVFYPGPF